MAPPAYIFVVRHGNRLDVADRHWHLSSPTPYDPPLTYSGWAQSRAVGTQISNILRDRSAQDANPPQPGQNPKKPKRYRIVIHSSPFVRCLQTSIAIGAGLMGKPSLLAPAQRNLSPAQVSQLAGAETAQANGSTTRPKQRRTSIVGKKVVLRIDAFLGEWLSPSYFELITPPPGSVMMLASAKASLLKAEDYKSYPHLQTRSHSNASAPVQPLRSQLWAASPTKSSSLSAPSASAIEDAATRPSLQNMAGMKDSLPAAAGATPVEVGAYDPPVPAFSMPKSATIPAGYVNHAKDACVVVDYQWDSMRPPYNWGDGGELPEDWPDMHKRFKKGLQELVDWYTMADDPASAVTTEYVKPGADGLIPAQTNNEEDENVETVVILVSHGAGCNAMIGAITHRPALMDVPISSLSMAALKKTGQAPNGVGPRATEGSIPLHQTYDLVLNASTDHLRSAAPTPNPSPSPSMASVYGGYGAGAARVRTSNSFSSPSGSGSSVTHMEGLNRSSSISGSVASIRRGLRDQAASSRTPSGLSVGLWSPAPKSDFEYGLEDEEAIEFDLKQPSSPPSSRGGHEHSDELDDQLTNLPKRSTRASVGGKGLWISDGGVSTPPSIPAAGPMRDLGSSKRRWTVTAERP
ncbi:hypothetical protein RB595_000235 [Gaeumannomyces hyphopodioides]